MRLVPFLLLGLLACSDGAPRSSVSLGHNASDTAAGFFAAPYPFLDRTTDAFPNPDGNVFVGQIIAASLDSALTHQTETIFFRASGAIEEVVVSNEPVLTDDVLLIDLERRSLQPIRARFDADAGPVGGENLLAVVPVQGFPLRANAMHAVVVRDSLMAADGLPLARDAGLQALLTDSADERVQLALRDVFQTGVDLNAIVGLSVFQTGDATAELRHVQERLLAETPSLLNPVLDEVFDDFCVYEAHALMPSLQQGEQPFAMTGGQWDLTAATRRFESRVLLTVPRNTEATAIPTVFFVRQGGGGDSPIVTRGKDSDGDGQPDVQGDGPGRWFAQEGYATASIDGPGGGLRNPGGADEQFVFFNFQNVRALRDNMRQAVVEVGVGRRALSSWTLDASACPGAPDAVTFDPSVLMGHSTGATIASAAFAVDDAFDAVVLSGAGGSYAENILFKESPIATRPLAEALVGYSGTHELDRFDPLLSLTQAATESADPPVYVFADESPRHVLMLQGVVDTFIPVPVANALSWPLRLRQGGSVVGEPRAGEESFLSRRDASEPEPFPLLPNETGALRALIQLEEDGLRDGHEIVFQSEVAETVTRCLLRSLLSGAPRVELSCQPL